MKVVISGASGLLGRAVLKEFSEAVGLCYSRLTPGLIRLNLTDYDDVKSFIYNEQPDFFIHCAAERHPDKCENSVDETKKLNVRASKFLAEELAEIGCPILYISTDYVFDGSSAPYTEESPTSPINFYGLTKRDGENVVLGASPKHLVLRVPVLYGPTSYLTEGAVTGLAQYSEQTEKILIDDKAKRYPTLTTDIAKVIKGLADKYEKGTNIGGIWHFSSKEEFTKYEMSKIIAKLRNKRTGHLIPDKKPIYDAPRPYNSYLDSTKIDNLLSPKRTPFIDGLKRVLDNCQTL